MQHAEIGEEGTTFNIVEFKTAKNGPVEVLGNKIGRNPQHTVRGCVVIDFFLFFLRHRNEIGIDQGGVHTYTTRLEKPIVAIANTGSTFINLILKKKQVPR